MLKQYWQTRSIARPLCDSTATCFLGWKPAISVQAVII